MNSAAYIFSNSGTYSQYPDDYAKEIFQTMAENASGESTVAIHRENNLMYYGYIYKFQQQYIGFGVLVNNVLLSDIDSIFRIFENAVVDLITTYKILKITGTGEIIHNSDSEPTPDTLSRIINHLREEFSKLEETATKLPPVNYSISNNQSKQFGYKHSHTGIVEASGKYAYTYICKNDEIKGIKTLMQSLHIQPKAAETAPFNQKEPNTTTPQGNNHKKKNSEDSKGITIISVSLLLFIAISFLIDIIVNENTNKTEEKTNQVSPIEIFWTDYESHNGQYYLKIFYKSSKELYADFKTRLSIHDKAKFQSYPADIVSYNLISQIPIHIGYNTVALDSNPEFNKAFSDCINDKSNITLTIWHNDRELGEFKMDLSSNK